MGRTVYQAGIDTRELFRIEFAGDCYFAIRESKPRFCLQGASITEVAASAERAFDLVKRVASSPTPMKDER